MNIDELPEELKQQVEAKFNAVLKAFLQSCTKDRRKKVTQFREPDFSELITSTSSAPATPEVRSFEQVR
jgi:late competence protein required for DNA uptake (superfamily II DNA/RNA helicase)